MDAQCDAATAHSKSAPAPTQPGSTQTRHIDLTVVPRERDLAGELGGGAAGRRVEAGDARAAEAELPAVAAQRGLPTGNDRSQARARDAAQK